MKGNEFARYSRSFHPLVTHLSHAFIELPYSGSPVYFRCQFTHEGFEFSLFISVILHIVCIFIKFIVESRYVLSLLFKVVIVRYRFSSDIVETSPIYCFMLLEYMCEVLKLLTIQYPKKLLLKKKLKKKLNTEFSMLRENLPTFSITINKYSLPLQSKSVVRLKAVSHYISQNL